jgi:hypothetical protein
MNSQTSKAIMKDLYRRFEITEEQAREIVRSQFRKLKLTMEEYSLDDENYPAIRLPKWGLFFVKPSKMKNYGKPEETN